MSAKRYLALLLFAITVLLIGQMTSVAIMDPAGIIHGRPKIWWHDENARWRVPGLIVGQKNLELVTLGDSMSEGFRPEMFGVDPQRYLNIALMAATIEEEAMALEMLLKHQAPKVVVWELYPSAIVRKERVPTRKNYRLLSYLYQDDPLSRIEYLVSAESISHLPKHAMDRILNQPRDADSLNKWAEDEKLFAAKNLLSEICSLGARTGPYLVNDDLLISKTETYILPIVERHPEIKFVFFVPAVSDAYFWALGPDAAKGMVDAHVYWARTFADRDNTQYMAFLDAPFIKDWSHYKDAIHHDSKGSAFEAREIMSARHDTPEVVMRKAAAILAAFPAIGDRIQASVDDKCWARINGNP